MLTSGATPKTMSHRPKQTARISLLLAATLMLNQCGNKPVNVNQQVRDQAEKNASLIQVTPMVPAAVISLLEEADEQISLGQIKPAILTLERALSISPNSALVQQHLAEAHLTDGHYQQALYWATLVVNQGPDKGALCERSRRAQALAAELLNEPTVQAQALESIASCTTAPAARF